MHIISIYYLWSKLTKELVFPNISEKPHQPFNLSFPKREFGKKTVSFQASWFKKHTWLHYDEERDVAFCHTCIRAYKEKKITWNAGNLDPAFISSGYYNWKDASVKLKKHMKIPNAILKLLKRFLHCQVPRKILQRSYQGNIDRRKWRGDNAF